MFHGLVLFDIPNVYNLFELYNVFCPFANVPDLGHLSINSWMLCSKLPRSEFSLISLSFLLANKQYASYRIQSHPIYDFRSDLLDPPFLSDLLAKTTTHNLDLPRFNPAAGCPGPLDASRAIVAASSSKPIS